VIRVDEEDERLLAAAHTAVREGQRKVRTLAQEARFQYQRRQAELEQCRRSLEELAEVLGSEAPGGQPGSSQVGDVAERPAMLGDEVLLREKYRELSEQVYRLQRTMRLLGITIRRLENESSRLLHGKDGLSQDGEEELQADTHERVIQAHEQERLRLAREIHDGPAQILANAVFELEYFDRLVEHDPSALKEQLSQLVTREMGKVIAEGRGDVQEAIDMTFYMAGEGRRLFGHTVPSELPSKFATSLRDPVGVVAAITPWNFPIAIPSWKLTAALICGNTVVFKPASDTPSLAAELVKIYAEAGLPDGVLNLITGSGGDVGDTLVNHPGVDVVSFTGSTETGASVLAQTAGRLKRVSLEMGGKNAIMVMEDADLELAVEGILWSAFGTTGQRCTAASRVMPIGQW